MSRFSAGKARLACFAVLWGLATAGSAMAAEPHANSRRFHLDAPCARVFPLFTAIGEKQWAEGWEPELLSGGERRGSAFRTRHPDGRTTTWIVTAYEPSAGRVGYARLAEGSNIGLVDVRCAKDGTGSAVEVTYTLTGLDAEGDAFAAGFTADAHYSAMIDEWKEALTKVLAAGP